MSDLVKRLREIAVIITSRNVMSHWDAMMADVDAQYCNEAAAEIERLTAERLVMLAQFETYRVRMEKIVALEAELKRVQELHTGLMKNADDRYDALKAELAAAKAALQTHPCILEDGNFDHEWKFVDESFDHEYGTQIEQYYECTHCKATQDYEGDDE